MTEMVSLQAALVWLLTGGGAGWVTYWLIEKVPVLAALLSEPKRYVAWALSAVIAWAASDSLACSTSRASGSRVIACAVSVSSVWTSATTIGRLTSCAVSVSAACASAAVFRPVIACDSSDSSA